jgi:hypothetical protein
MKGLEYVAIVAGLLLLWHLSNSRETFVPEMLELSGVKHAAANSHSSYDQRTNHMIPTPPLLEKVPGMETPFRVNMFNSFQPV